jgi:hypothetical protein
LLREKIELIVIEISVSSAVKKSSSPARAPFSKIGSFGEEISNGERRREDRLARKETRARAVGRGQQQHPSRRCGCHFGSLAANAFATGGRKKRFAKKRSFFSLAWLFFDRRACDTDRVDFEFRTAESRAETRLERGRGAKRKRHSLLMNFQHWCDISVKEKVNSHCE